MNLFDAVAGKTSRMNHVNRYSTFPVIRKENVAEHSWWVAFISLLIVEDMQNEGMYLSLETVLRRAVCHDLSEVISGDIIRSYKHTNEHVKRAMDEADTINMAELCESYGEAGTLIIGSWAMAKGDPTLPNDLCGDVVAFADLACVAFYCRAEHRMGNTEVEPVLKDMYESWFNTYHDHAWLSKYADQMFPDRHWSDMLERDHGARAAWPGQGSPIQPTRTEGPVSDHDWPHTEGAM